MNLTWRTMAMAAPVLLAVAERAQAQAPINSNVALQPSTGGLIIRQQFRYAEGDAHTPMGKVDVESASSITTLVYGLTDAWTLILDAPLVLSRRLEHRATGADDTEAGFADLGILTKWRLYRDDFGPTSTTRFDLIGGLSAPTGRNAFTSDSFDPILGGVFSHIQNRHAFHTDALWRFNTGGGDFADDLFKYDLAYSYRIAPETYASTRPTALFGTIELNGSYETNNDQELFISPGVQFVATRWIIEATVQIPLWQDLHHRAERDFIVGIGFRVQF